MRIRMSWGLVSLATLAVASAWGQSGENASLWNQAVVPVDARSNPVAAWIENYHTFRVNPTELRATLGRAPLQAPGQFSKFSVIDLPMPNGSVRQFRICESPIMTEAIANRIGVKTYFVQGILNPVESGRLDLGPNGFHGFVRSTNGESFVIEPVKRGDQTAVFSYYRRDNVMPRTFQCLTQDTGFPGLRGSNLRFGTLSTGGTMKTYRLAMNATGEYTAFHGGETQGLAAIATSVNRMNSVYEIEAAIHLNMIYSKAFTDPNTDPYTNDNGFTMLGENQTETDASVGDANYDMGHVFSTGGGGVAMINSVGISGLKAQGVTGLPAPVGDNFDIDFVAHEMGHQWGGRHTFNNCQGGAEDGHSFEPGSATTIMGYAGICGSDDVQPHSDPYFHTHNLDQIVAHRNDPASGGTEANNGNAMPVVNAGSDITIPRGTPFKLTGTATDANNDPLTYCWEAFDWGHAATDMPLFRSINPSPSSTRFFPKIATVAAGATDRWETLPTVDRIMNFRMTVRDNRAGGGAHNIDAMVVTVAGAPFAVTAPNTAVTWNGNSQQTVTWDKGGSTAATVNILISKDAGVSYGNGTATVVLANTPNDGSATIFVPNVDATQGRVIVESASGSGFYDMSDQNITIVADNSSNAPTITAISPGAILAGSANFTLTVTGTNFVPTSKVRWFGADRPTTFVSATELQATIGASDIAFAQSVKIQVVTPPPGGGQSNQLDFFVNNPVPTISAMNPTSRPAGTNGFTLTLTGTNFVSTSRVSWNGVQRNTVFISPTKVSTTISAADLVAPGNVTVRVVNAAPGGGNSNPQTFSIVNNAPSSIAIFPGSLTGGQAATAAVYLNGPAPAGGLQLAISAIGSAITVPGTVTAAAGSYSAVFTVNTIPVSIDTTNTVRATANGVTVSKTMVIRAPIPNSVTLNPNTVTSGQGATGTFTLNGPAPAGGINVTIASGVPGLVQVPTFVFVPAGSTSGTFAVTTKPYGNTASIAVWALFRNRGSYALLTLNP